MQYCFFMGPKLVQKQETAKLLGVNVNLELSNNTGLQTSPLLYDCGFAQQAIKKWWEGDELHGRK